MKLQDLNALYSAMLDGNSEAFEQELLKQLRKTISYMDSAESFYHGFLLGIMANLKEYRIKSNRESGDGRYDICIYSLDVSIPPVILELKVAKKYKKMEAACEAALAQIKDRNYLEAFEDEGYTEAICYGVGF